MLKFQYDTDSEIPEPLKAYYAAGSDGKYYLQADGVVPKAKFEEFRTTNVNLLKERDTLKAQFEGVDPAEYKTLKERKDLLDQGKLVSAEGVDAAVKKRTEAMTTEHSKALAAIEQRAVAAEKQVATFMIDGELMKAGSEARVKPTAASDLMRRGREVFRVKDGKLEALDPNGNPIYGIGGEAMTPKEYVAQLVKEAPHLFEESTGAGASGSGAGSKTDGDGNPFLTTTWNLTAQSELRKKDPAKAARLKQSAIAQAKYGPPRK